MKRMFKKNKEEVKEEVKQEDEVKLLVDYLNNRKLVFKDIISLLEITKSSYMFNVYESNNKEE